MQKFWIRVRNGLGQNKLDAFLDDVENLPVLSAVAVIVGLLAGLIIVAFRKSIELGSQYLLGIEVDRFEDLPQLTNLLLPIAGAAIAALLIWFLKQENRMVGVVHVMERLSSSDVRMPLKNMLVQFIGGSTSLMLGISGGREGPAIHLGATAGSWVAHRFRLPHGSVRVIVACGVAAAIASSFDMPIASVIFTMEVILMEYTIASFLPVMLSAFTATALVRQIYTEPVVFQGMTSELISYWEIPYIVCVGVAIGLCAALFNYSVEFFTRIQKGKLWHRMLAAGVFTGCVGWFLPQVLGMGWDSANGVIQDPLDFSLTLLLVLLVAKLFVTSVCVGFSLPVGIIGPTIVMGVVCGSAAGLLGPLIFGDHSISQPNFYGLLGACAMLAAVLNAPLTAIMTVVELSGNLNFVMPALLIIVASTITVYATYGRRSIFVARLNSMNIAYPPHPSIQYLRRTNIRSAIDTFTHLIDAPEGCSIGLLRSHLRKIRENLGSIRWVILRTSADSHRVSDIDQFDRFVRNCGDMDENHKVELEFGSETPVLSDRSTLEEALIEMNAHDVNILTVRPRKRIASGTIGVVTREYIERIQTQRPTRRQLT